MNLIVSTPTSRGGGLLTGPVWGIAHVAVDGSYTMPISMDGATLEDLREVVDGATVLDGKVVCECEVWFEDARERSH